MLSRLMVSSDQRSLLSASSCALKREPLALVTDTPCDKPASFEARESLVLGSRGGSWSLVPSVSNPGRPISGPTGSRRRKSPGTDADEAHDSLRAGEFGAGVLLGSVLLAFHRWGEPPHVARSDGDGGSRSRSPPNPSLSPSPSSLMASSPPPPAASLSLLRRNAPATTWAKLLAFGGLAAAFSRARCLSTR